MKDRRIPLKTISNCRDLGGLSAAGNVIRPGMLLRSANLSRAEEEDLADLRDQHRLCLVVDLRTDREVVEMPDHVAEGIEYEHRPILHEAMMGITHEFDTGYDQPKVKIPVMKEMYRQVVSDEECIRNLGLAVGDIVDHDFTKGSVLWHCTEGKDRCGMVSALLLAGLGVSREDILADYLLTNETNGPKAEGYYQRLMQEGKPQELATFVKDAFLAKEEYLHTAFEVIYDRNGSPGEYLVDRLGISEDRWECFRRSILTSL